jgi:GxxExxY protein
MSLTARYRTEEEILTIMRKSIAQAHALLGPGEEREKYIDLLTEMLVHEGLLVRQNPPFPVFYKGRKFDVGFYGDLLVNDIILACVREADLTTALELDILLNYLRHSERRIGFFINFAHEQAPQVLERRNPAFSNS